MWVGLPIIRDTMESDLMAWPREGAPAAADGARGYLPFLVSFLSFFSFVVSLGLFVFAVRFLF